MYYGPVLLQYNYSISLILKSMTNSGTFEYISLWLWQFLGKKDYLVALSKAPLLNAKLIVIIMPGILPKNKFIRQSKTIKPSSIYSLGDLKSLTPMLIEFLSKKAKKYLKFVGAYYLDSHSSVLI